MPNMDEEDVRRFVTRGTGSQLADNKSLKDMLDDIEGSGFATGTDSLKVLSDVLDAIEGSGFSTTTDSLKILSDVLDLIRTELTFQHQADATLSQTNPVSGQKYTVLDTTANVRLIGVAVQCTWSGQPTPLEVHITIDGQSITFSIANPGSTTWYNTNLSDHLAPTAQELQATGNLRYRAFQLEGRSVKVEAEITGGTVSNLSARCLYAKR